MLTGRIAFTAAVMVAVVWLSITGRPFGGLVLVPLAAISMRRAAEDGRLSQLARRAVNR